MTTHITTAPADPVPGASGHFNHHVWLRTSVVSLDTAVAALEVRATSLEAFRTGLAAQDVTGTVTLEKVVDALVALGLVHLVP
jgi:hypothetical protein